MVHALNQEKKNKIKNNSIMEMVLTFIVFMSTNLRRETTV